MPHSKWFPYTLPTLLIRLVLPAGMPPGFGPHIQSCWDMYSDFTMMRAQLGVHIVEVLETDDLQERILTYDYNSAIRCIAASGIPASGESCLKTCLAIMRMGRFGTTAGCYKEFYVMDFRGIFGLVGRDGPIAISDATRPVLRRLGMNRGKLGYGVLVEFKVETRPVTILGRTRTGGQLKLIGAVANAAGPFLRNCQHEFAAVISARAGRISLTAGRWKAARIIARWEWSATRRTGKLPSLLKISRVEVK